MVRRKILKNRVFLIPFSAFLRGILFIEQLMNEKKILGILTGTPELGGGQEGQLPPLPFAGRGKGGQKV